MKSFGSAREKNCISVSALFILVIIASLLIPAAYGQANGDSKQLLADLRANLQEARTHFESVEQSRAVPALSRIIDTCARYKSLAQFEPETRKSIQQAWTSALEMRAQVFYTLGEMDRATVDFKSLLTVAPEYHLDAMQVSPKIVSLFEEIRRQTVGNLSVTSTPPLAEVFIDGELIGVAPIIAKGLGAGTYRLSLNLRGYAPYEEIIQVDPDRLIERSVQLEMNSGDCVFFTSPPGVSVYLDSQLVDTTSGEAPARETEFLKRHGLDPTEVSAPFTIPLVSLGEHEFTFSRRGWSIRRFKAKVSAGENRFPPVVLEPSRCKLTLRSNPVGAKIYLSGDVKPIGTAPIVAQDVPAGNYRMDVVFEGIGKWFETVSFEKDDVIELECRPRPTLLLLGIIGGEEVSSDAIDSVSKRVVKSLKNVRGLNRILPSDENYPEGIALMALGSMQDAERSKRLMELAQSMDVDLILLGRYPKVSEGQEGLHQRLVLELYSSLHQDFDAKSLSLDAPGEIESVLSALDHQTASAATPWTGLSVIDTNLGQGAFVIRASPSSPAQESGLVPGDVVVKAQETPVAEVADFMKIIRSAAMGSELNLEVRRGETAHDVKLRVGSSPTHLPIASKHIFYNQALAEFDLLRKSNSGLAKNVALLNMGICLMHFGEYEKAITTCFRHVEMSRPSGVNDGTVQFFLGECCRQLGELEQAIKAYERAAASEESTFEFDGGLRVRPAAMARLKQMTP